MLTGCRGFWNETVGAVQVKTPDRSMDIMLNGWLTYQTLACRVWARSGFYQASGAYGFRDQLQDCMALATLRPSMTRDHLLRAAGRQFAEGDVQHWWLPHSGQGVRTRISDDRVWLAYAAAHYVEVTGDAAVLDEVVALPGRPGAGAGRERQLLPADRLGRDRQPLRALRPRPGRQPGGRRPWPAADRRRRLERRHEPRRRRRQGRERLAWLAVARRARRTSQPSPMRAATRRGRRNGGRTCEALATALESQAWDGDWYRRGWFDDGTPLGSATNEECRIDSIAQSWAVISGAARPDRAAQAMAAVERELILPHDGLALLFTPPFDRSPLDPGYIKGYPPGVRENGGQYTHAALWSVMAFAGLGEGDKAAALFWMLNPINHARTRTDMHRYKVEPYVVAADVYAAPGHVGRGGWTWYTGSAGWMQRAGVESILGLRIEGDKLRLDPCIPGVLAPI